MKFLIIIPCHNEEKNILYCLESLKKQSFQNIEVVVVNDGSTDQSEKIINKVVQENANFQLINLKYSAHEPGSKVVKTFNVGLESKNLADFEVICKFDSDIIFPDNYLEKITEIYSKYPKVGMVSGIVKIKKDIFDKKYAFDFKNDRQHWVFENISSKDHVRGPIKSYRTACFLDMNGLRPVLGWDNLDVMLAQKSGWKTITIKDLWVKHLRPTAYKYKKQKAKKLGEYFYNIGLSFPLAMLSSAKSSFKNHSFSEFFITMISFFKQKSVRSITEEEIKYIRNLRWKMMFGRGN